MTKHRCGENYIPIMLIFTFIYGYLQDLAIQVYIVDINYLIWRYNFF